MLRTALALGLSAAAVCCLATPCWSQEKPVVIYTRDNAPAAPELDELPLKSSVSHYGITWTFEKPAHVGRFVNGDYYVVGPVTITQLDPKPLVGDEVPESERDKTQEQGVKKEDFVRNGSMLNPPAIKEVAYDSGIMNYFRSQRLSLPSIRMKPGDSLVSTISLKHGEDVPSPFYGPYDRSRRGEGGFDFPLKVAAILTCVEKPLPPDAFRPAYCDRSAKIYYSRDLRRDALPRLPLLGDRKDTRDPLEDAVYFQKPWVNTGFFGFDAPWLNMHWYGANLAGYAGGAGLKLCLDFPADHKEPLLINMTQIGIDYWGAVKSGHPGWMGFGGHGHARKFLIVFAGFMLGDEDMMSPSRKFPKTEFSEDNQTRYGACWTGATVVFAGHYGISSATGKPYSNKGAEGGYGPYEHLPPSQWTVNEQDAKYFGLPVGENYRRNCTSNAWVSEALVLRILKLEKQWDHDPFFDYMDRWMYEEDSLERRKEIVRCFPKASALLDDVKGDISIQGNVHWCGAWVKPYWDKYRTMEGMPPTDGWKRRDRPRDRPEWWVPLEIEKAARSAAADADKPKDLR
jgi:hypothetical protein